MEVAALRAVLPLDLALGFPGPGQMVVLPEPFGRITAAARREGGGGLSFDAYD